MRHERSIDLLPDDPTPMERHEFSGATLGTFKQWEILGGRCVACRHQGWVDKDDLRKRWDNHYLITLQPFLRCTKCQNKGDNRWIAGKMARD